MSAPAPTPARHHGYLEGVDGLRLHYRSWEPAEPLAAAMLVHDLGEHGGLYAPLGERLANLGVAALAPDLRGHGRSDGRRGHVARFETFLQDLDRLRCETRALAGPGSPLFLFGAGLGGLVVLRYLQEFHSPVDGAVVVAPWLVGPPLLPAAASLARTLGRVLPSLRLKAGIGRARGLRSPAAGAPPADDPLAHDCFTPRFYREAAAAAAQVVRRRGRISTPLLVLLPDDDRGADPERPAALLSTLDHPALEVRRWKGGRPDRLAGTAAEPLLAAVMAWLTDRIAQFAAETAVGAGTGLARRGSAEHTMARP